VVFFSCRDGDHRIGPPAGLRKGGDTNMVLQQETGIEKHRSDDVERNGVKRL
jgi:hypothetical protein